MPAAPEFIWGRGRIQAPSKACSSARFRKPLYRAGDSRAGERVRLPGRGDVLHGRTYRRTLSRPPASRASNCRVKISSPAGPGFPTRLPSAFAGSAPRSFGGRLLLVLRCSGRDRAAQDAEDVAPSVSAKPGGCCAYGRKWRRSYGPFAGSGRAVWLAKRAHPGARRGAGSFGHWPRTFLAKPRECLTQSWPGAT